MGNRRIQIDIDTIVGYNFLNSKFYVTNKGYTTYRPTSELTYNLLHEVFDISSISQAEIEDLKEIPETITSLSYTWQDNGAYIKTIQINDFIDYPLTLDCEKAKLYIMNSNVVFDLTINESPSKIRVPYLCNYYKDCLGISIPEEDMRILYDLLISFYSPTCYNQIATPSSTSDREYTYTNTYATTNYKETSPAVYSCTQNPYNRQVPLYISNIFSTNTEDNSITLTETPVGLSKGDQIQIQGTTTTSADMTYSADGTYTISELKDNIIYVKEVIPYPYTNPNNLYINAINNINVESMERETNTITLVNNAPNNLLVGDTIVISNALTEATGTPTQQISCNGYYTVSSVSNKEIVVEESIPTDFHAQNTNYAKLSKLILVSGIASIQPQEETSIIYLLTPIPETLTNLQGSAIAIYIGETIMGNATVSAVSEDRKSITVVGNIDYEPFYPVLNLLVPSTETLINITYAQDEFNYGEFMVDNFEECQKYIFMANAIIPDYIGTNILNKVEDTYTIAELTTGQTSMALKGLYSQIYPNEE